VGDQDRRWAQERMADALRHTSNGYFMEVPAAQVR
jgi:hypothetical protein